MPSTSHTICLSDEAGVYLRSDCTISLPAQSTLLIADAHFGKEATFRRAGIPIPESRTHGDLQRIESALVETGASRLIFLGDFIHSKEGVRAETLATLQRWRASTAAKEVTLVKGNHDHLTHEEAASIGMKIQQEPWRLGDFLFAHYPQVIEDALLTDGMFAFAGHLHPGIRLRPQRKAGSGLRAPCFIVRQNRVIMPAFGEFTGLADVTPTQGEAYYLVTGGALIPYRP